MASSDHTPTLFTSNLVVSCLTWNGRHVQQISWVHSTAPTFSDLSVTPRGWIVLSALLRKGLTPTFGVSIGKGLIIARHAMVLRHCKIEGYARDRERPPG